MPAVDKQFLSTADAAERLGYTVQHTRLLIREGKLAATKFGRDWLVERQAVERLRALRSKEDQRGSTC